MRLAVIVVAVLVWARVAGAQGQDLGHRLPGSAGIDAGTQVDQGLYFADRFVWFSSERVKDRRGDTIPINGFELDAYANVFGVAGTLELAGLYLSAAVAVPLVKLSAHAAVAEASVDRFGFGDVFVEPLKLGHRFAHGDVVGSYSFYAPTGQGEQSGVGRPQWSHQLSGGGTLFFDDRRGWRVTALASYLHNHKKLGIDITRGDTFQIQGGVGGRLFSGLEIGVAAYALWQITDDRGSELPPALRGARERAFGLGPEVGLTIPSLRSRVIARYEWDLAARARPAGTILVVGISVVAWR